MSFKKLINLFLIVFFIAFSAIVCLTRFNNTPLISDNNNNLQIYELWHIESFEGGGANRQNYLNRIALNYEKQNPNQIFMIKSINPDQLQDALTLGCPHLISFSEQVANIVLPYLMHFDNEYDIQNNFIESAKFNGNLMALPYIASGYCYFTKNNSSTNLELYTANNNLHNATSLINKPINNNQTLSSYECYSKFVNNNNIKLLGTARDLFRIKNLESLGRFSVTYEPISTFTDLIQYLGVTTTDKNVLNFVEFMLNDNNQHALSKLSLFSTKNINLYTDAIYKQMEQSINQCFVPNIFTI